MKIAVHFRPSLLFPCVMLAALAAADARADVKLPNIFGDHMVLQQGQKNKVWGLADAGEPESFQLRAGEGRSFDASNSITVRLSEGNTAHVIVSGVDYGFPGRTGEPWEDTFSYDEPSAPGG